MKFRKGAIYMDMDFKQYLQYGKHGVKIYKTMKKLWVWKKRLQFRKKKKCIEKNPVITVKKQTKQKAMKIHYTKLLGRTAWAVKNRYF